MNVVVNSLELWCEWFNDSGEPLLLISGVGGQGYDWSDDFCALLAERGFRVLRFDLRDSGKSTWLAAGVPDVEAIRAGDFTTVSYYVEDLASDAIGLIEAFEVEQVHVVGHSLGGMVAQAVAIASPGRVKTLTCIASTTGDRSVGKSSPKAIARQTERAALVDDEDIVARWIESRRSQWGSGFPFDEDATRIYLQRMADRGTNGEGRLRQLAAAVCSPDRTDALRKLQLPALVVHGTDDPLVDLSGGIATAGVLQNSKLMQIEGMGHYLVPEKFCDLADEIRRLADAALA